MAISKLLKEQPRMCYILEKKGNWTNAFFRSTLLHFPASFFQKIKIPFCLLFPKLPLPTRPLNFLVCALLKMKKRNEQNFYIIWHGLVCTSDECQFLESISAVFLLNPFLFFLVKVRNIFLQRIKKNRKLVLNHSEFNFINILTIMNFYKDMLHFSFHTINFV